jgi:hypothetical protein
VMLVTSSELATDLKLDCCSADDNIFGAAPTTKITHMELEGQVFFFGNDQRFLEIADSLISKVKEEGCSVLTMALGFEDVRVGILLDWTLKDISDAIVERLCSLVGQTGVPLVFGGLLQLGCPTTRTFVRGIHLNLFERASELKKFAITMFECTSPSPSAPIEEVYDDQGIRYTCKFRAVCLYSLSRATALNFDNQVWPNPMVKASQSDADFAVFASKCHAGLNN